MLSKHFYSVIAHPRSIHTSHLVRSTILNSIRLRSSHQSSFSSTSYNMAEYKLKGLTALTLKNGDKVEAEVEGIEGGKVLLVKLNGKVHAMNANCTHYGAPLKMGILTPEGRLTCPWHGGQSDQFLIQWDSVLNTNSLLPGRDWRY